MGLQPAAAQTAITGATQIGSGHRHTCVLTSSGGVKCWGENGVGSLGDGSTTSRNTPVAALQAPTATDSPVAHAPLPAQLATAGYIAGVYGAVMNMLATAMQMIA